MKKFSILRMNPLNEEKWICFSSDCPWYYNDVIMSAMTFLIISLTSVYSTVYSRRKSKETSKLHVTGLCVGNSPVTSEFPAQKASNAENVSIWWRHHGKSSKMGQTIHFDYVQISMKHFTVILLVADKKQPYNTRNTWYHNPTCQLFLC